MNVQRILVLLGLFAMNFCRPASGPTLELHQIFEESWNYQLQEFPVFATMVGVQDRNHQLASVSEADQQRRADYWRQIKQRLQGLEPGALEADDRVNYDIFLRQLEDDLSAHQFKSYLIPITAETGFHTGFARLPSIVPLENRRDYDNYLSRAGIGANLLPTTYRVDAKRNRARVGPAPDRPGRLSLNHRASHHRRPRPERILLVLSRTSPLVSAQPIENSC